MSQEQSLLIAVLSIQYVKALGRVLVYTTIEGHEEYFFFRTVTEARQAETVLREVFQKNYAWM